MVLRKATCKEKLNVNLKYEWNENNEEGEIMRRTKKEKNVIYWEEE